MAHQPAFDHPLLRNHTIQVCFFFWVFFFCSEDENGCCFLFQMRPNFHPEGVFSDSKVTSKASITQLWHLKGRCPEGTIPIRRTKRDDILRASSVESYGKKRAHATVKPSSIDIDFNGQNGHQVLAETEYFHHSPKGSFLNLRFFCFWSC